MRLSHIANVLDLDHDEGRLIEIGLTTVAIKERCLVQTYSIPLKPDFDISAEISQLTGWTNSKLLKCGVSKEEASRLLDKCREPAQQS